MTFDDVAAAIEAVRTAYLALVDSTSVAIGHSTGGHLALMAQTVGKVSASIGLAPITDLRRCAREGLGEGATPLFIGAEATDT